MKASVVIPAYNAERNIGRCIESLHNQTISSDQIEVIVVDDGSSDKTGRVAESYGAKVIRLPGKGAAAARNAGAREAHCDILLFTDSDCVPAKNWVEAMLSPFSEPDVAGVKGVYKTEQSALISRFVQVEYETKYERMSRFETIDFIDTYSAGFRRDIFLKLGGFDESFPGASVEDQEFSFRLQEAGYKMVFNPRAVVFHLHVDTWLGYIKKKYKIGYWKVKVLQRHPEKLVKDTHTPQLLKAQIPLSFLIPATAMVVPITGVVPFLVNLLLFFLCAGREIYACLYKDGLLLGLIAPFFLISRSWSLGLGLLRGWMEM